MKIHVSVITLIVMGSYIPCIPTGQPPECYTEHEVTYHCLPQDDNKMASCIPGRHLKLPESSCSPGDVQSKYKACVPCEGDTYMDKHNACDECLPRTVCGPNEVPTKDGYNSEENRECVPRTTSDVAVTSPPCSCTCPVCPSIDTPLTPSTSIAPTMKQLDTATDGHTPGVGALKSCEEEKWHSIAIVFMVIAVLLIVVLVMLCVKYRSCIAQRHMPDCKNHQELPVAVSPSPSIASIPEEGTHNTPRPVAVSPSPSIASIPEEGTHNTPRPDDGPRDQNANVDDVIQEVGEENEMHELCDNEASSSNNGRQRGSSQENDDHSSENTDGHMSQGQRPSTSNMGARPGSTSTNDASCRDSAEEQEPSNIDPCPESVSIGESAGLLRGPSSVVDEDESGARVSKVQGNKPPKIKKDYDAGKGTPSTQPLLGNSLADDSIQSSQNSGAHCQTLPLSNASNLSSSPTNNNGPTVPHKSHPPEPSNTANKVWKAYEKREGQSGIVTDCSEDHIDFVKDHIRIETRRDFYAKLGINSKVVREKEHDAGSEPVREKIRYVLLTGFLSKAKDVSISKLLKALEESENADVARDFIKVFNAYC